MPLNRIGRQFFATQLGYPSANHCLIKGIGIIDGLFRAEVDELGEVPTIVGKCMRRVPLYDTNILEKLGYPLRQVDGGQIN